MLSKIPIDFDKIKKEDLEKEILRIGIIAELDAINLYEQLASYAQNDGTRKSFWILPKKKKLTLENSRRYC